MILIAGSLFVFTQTAMGQKTPQDLGESVAKAYVESDLGTLKDEGFFYRSVRIVIEHSLSGDENKMRTEDATFRSFAAADKWLKARGPAEYPFNRETQPLMNCEKGMCTYGEPALLHNTLFLTKVTYGMRNGMPYVKTIYFVDGD